MNGRPVTRHEFHSVNRRMNFLYGLVGALLFLMIALTVYVVAKEARQTKANRVVDLAGAVNRAVSLCQSQNSVLDTLVLAAIDRVEAGPDSPAARKYLRIFREQHAILADPATCQGLRTPGEIPRGAGGPVP